MTSRKLALRVTASLTAMTAATAVSAQIAPPAADSAVAADAAANGQEIIVTGSRIRRDPLNQDSPVITLDQSALAQTGLSAVADILQRLPSASGGLNSKVNNSGNLGNPPDGGGVGAGSAEIDLRYLGAKRTLVLVDGIRFVNATSASGIPATVDLNTIPANMIDRIEVLQAGASPLYGSDAIAGVVNVITVSQQKGLRLSAQYGQFLKEKDGETQDYQASWGNGSSGPIKIAFGATYVKQQQVRSANRSISQFPNPGQTTCDSTCSSATLAGRFDLRADANVGSPLYGNFTIANFPDSTPTFAELRPWRSPQDRFNFAPFQYILTPSERYGGWASVKADIGADTHFRVRGEWNRRKSQNQAAFEPLFIGPDAGNGAGSLFDTLSIDRTNPFNPFGITLESGVNPDGTLNGRTPTYSTVRRRLVEAGQRTFTQRVTTYSATATLDGAFDVGPHKWYWDVNGSFGVNKARQSFTGNVRADRVAQALGPLAACTAPCVPLNIFGGAGSITQAMLDYIGFTEHDESQQKVYDFTANLNGDIIDLPAGPVGFAVGYEHRKQSAFFTPDPIVSAGLGADIPALPSSGKYNTDEVYAELRVPILKETPGFYSLEANGAVRHANYSISGASTTYTITGLWKPVQDILLRGSYSTGFRAPSIGELFGDRSRFDLAANDPCTSAAGGLFQGNTTVRANCIANGVPANGTYAEDQGGQLPVLTKGNRNLKPEKSRNFTLGAVYSPRWARAGGSNFSAEVNYYDIKLTNAIGAVDPSLTLNNCALLGDAASCALIKRTANGFINEIDGTLGNLDSIRTKGIDATINYRSPPTPIGTLGLTANATFLLKYILTASNGFVSIDRRGTERGSPDQAFPKVKFNVTADWSKGPLAASLTGRYIDGVTEFYDVPPVANRLGSRFYADAQLRVTPDFMDRGLVFTLGVNNLFDSDPPGCFSCGVNNYDPTTYDVPGRFGYARVTFKM